MNKAQDLCGNTKYGEWWVVNRAVHHTNRGFAWVLNVDTIYRYNGLLARNCAKLSF